MDQASYFEQSDQPASDNSQFQDFYVEDYEPEGELQFGGSKFARHPSMEPPVFQSLCPTKRTDVFLNVDSDYEYRPSSYVEVKCEEFYYSCDAERRFHWWIFNFLLRLSSIWKERSDAPAE